MVDKRRLAIALAALVLVIAVAVGLSLASREQAPKTKAEARAVEAQQEAVQDLCASRDTFQGLKKLVFDRASSLRTGERANFDILAASAFPRMENPVVASRDEALDVTRCTGRFILELPPGAERAFNGERRLLADVRYEVQPAADGSGPVYRMTGADRMISRLADFELQGEPLTLPDDVLDTASDESEPPAGEGNEAAAVFPPERIVTQPRTAPVGEWSNPSFDCRNARTRSEIMICGSERLARRDRTGGR